MSWERFIMSGMPTHLPIQIKICGLSDEATLHAAVDAGANFVGFVHFPKSPRHVSLERAAALKALVPPHVKTVMVMVDPPDELVDQVMQMVAPDYIQLHGSEDLEALERIRTRHPLVKTMKAIPVASVDDLVELLADILLFDTKPPKGAVLPGGNGVAFDWSIMRHYQGENPWMLSGGLTPENVAEAIATSGASMVDVSSGVESAPGKKSIEKIRAFIKAARA